MVLPRGRVLALAGHALVVQQADAVRQVRAVVLGVVLGRAGQEGQMADGVRELGWLLVPACAQVNSR